MSTHSIRIPEKLEKEINFFISPNFSKSTFIRKALTEYVKRERFKQLRRSVLPFAEAQGLLTDEGIFEEIS